MSREIKLKDCPFCWATKRIKLEEDFFGKGSSDKFCICCNECECTGPFGNSMKEAIKAWNTRSGGVDEKVIIQKIRETQAYNCIMFDMDLKPDQRREAFGELIYLIQSLTQKGKV